jgi:hypothetical protein
MLPAHAPARGDVRTNGICRIRRVTYPGALDQFKDLITLAQLRTYTGVERRIL